MIYYQPTYKDAKFILATTDEPRAIWMVGDKTPTVKPTALLGSIEWTYAILDSLGVERPRVIDYQTFPSMRKHFHRKTWRQLCIDVLDFATFPVFVKPSGTLKTWTGRVFESRRDFNISVECTKDMMCDCSEPVEFTDEIRTFWRRLELYDSENRSRGYSAGWNLVAAVGYPQVNEEADYRFAECLGIANGVAEIWPDNDLPCSTLVIDIGTMNGKQAIVEIGDMFAMGTYGADSEYLRCHKQWCRELFK